MSGSSSEKQEGGCLCGAVRYRVMGAPTLVDFCHCSSCRKAGGAPVVVWADYPLAAVTWLRGTPREHASSPKARRGFCGACGTQLTFASLETPDQISFTLCTLDQPEAFPPSQHIFHGEKLPWLALSDDLPRHAEREIEQKVALEKEPE